MENEEKILLGSDETDESGYSEKQLSQNTELQAGQWLDLKQTKKPTQSKKSSNQNTPAYPSTQPARQSSSDNAAILLDYQQKTWEKLAHAIGRYREELALKHDISELLTEIQQLQTTLNSVLKALRWEQKGSLDISKLPKEVQNLLK